MSLPVSLSGYPQLLPRQLSVNFIHIGIIPAHDMAGRHDLGWARGGQHLDEPNNVPFSRKLYFSVSRQEQKWHLWCRVSAGPWEGQSKAISPGHGADDRLQYGSLKRSVIYVGPGDGQCCGGTDGGGMRKE